MTSADSSETPPALQPRASWRESMAVYLQPRVLIVLLLGFSSGLPLANCFAMFMQPRFTYDARGYGSPLSRGRQERADHPTPPQRNLVLRAAQKLATQ